MKERGEATILAMMALVSLTGLLFLCSLELVNSFRLLKKRTDLFLCTREARGELNNYLVLMGRSNWAIKNIDRAKWVMIFIPGLQGVALNADKARKLLIAYQDINLPIYLAKLGNLARKRCQLDPGIYQTPYQLGPRGYSRDLHGGARIRNRKWTYYFVSSPYVLSIEIDTLWQEAVMPKVRYLTKEKGVRSSSLSSLVY